VVLSFYLKNESGIDWKGAKVIELGSGTGLVGIVLALLDVVLTDKIELLDLCLENVEVNVPSSVSVEVRELVWGKPVSFGTVDYIIASDVLQYDECYEDLIKTLLDLTDNKTIVFISLQKRRVIEEFEFYKLFWKYFDFRLVPNNVLHPNFQHYNLHILYGWKKQKPDTSPLSVEFKGIIMEHE